MHLNKERLQGPTKNIKALQHSPFEGLEKVGGNVYRFSLPPYMQIYSILNVENLKLYEPSMLDHQTKLVLPTIKDLELEAQEKLE